MAHFLRKCFPEPTENSVRSETAEVTSILTLFEVRGFNLPPCAVADVEHFHAHLFLQDVVYHTIDMGFSYRVGKFGRGGTDDELEKPLNPV